MSKFFKEALSLFLRLIFVTPGSDLWVREADEWLEELKRPNYLYKKSDLVSVMSEYDAATTDSERYEIVREMNRIMGSIDPQHAWYCRPSGDLPYIRKQV